MAIQHIVSEQRVPSARFVGVKIGKAHVTTQCYVDLPSQKLGCKQLGAGDQELQSAVVTPNLHGETSQCLTDVIITAVKMPAVSISTS